MSETPSLPALEQLPDDTFKRILCVVAHPDDVEYGISACVNRWVKGGAHVAYLLLTSGEAGMQQPPEVVGPLRAEEQRRACEAVGVTDLTILDHPDGSLVYGLDLRRDVARRIREFKPDVVVTGSWEVEVGWGLNQADHRAAGLAALDGCRDADNTWVHPELANAGLTKWGVTWLLVHGAPKPSHYVPLSEDDIAAGVASLEQHREYLAELGPDYPAPSEFIPGMLRPAGAVFGTPGALPFKAHKLV